LKNKTRSEKNNAQDFKKMFCSKELFEEECVHKESNIHDHNFLYLSRLRISLSIHEPLH